MSREGRTPFTSVFTIQVLGELNERQLRQALARVQAKHPLLRCVIEEAADAIRARGQQAEVLTLDVRDIEAVKTMIAAQAPFDILINNAGTNRPAPFVDVKVEDFDFVFSLNVRAAYFVAQALGYV